MVRFNNKKIKIFGFTLCEVLITLGIIGVVAEMTIPTLMLNARNAVLKAQFTKSYSVISQALIYTKMDLGVENLNVAYATYNGTTYPNAQEFTDAFYKQLKVTGTQTYTVYPVNFTNTANAYWYGIGKETPIRVLPDGSSIDCMIWASNINISVDINGPLKKPNRAGYDIFSFYVDTNDTIKPRRPDYLPQYYVCTQSSNDGVNGLGCSYYALIDRNPDDNTKGYWDSLK